MISTVQKRRLPLCWYGLLSIFLLPVFGKAQRNYAPASVLATGSWAQLSVAAEGIYKIDVPLLAALGFNGAVPSGQLRLYGNGGAMLPEDNAAARTDDLKEMALLIEDGGDGVLNGTDYALFYAPGPDRWLPDSAAQSFSHQKNLYSSKAFYFISIGGTGKRVTTQTAAPFPIAISTTFDERYFLEPDSINFLSSGKEWFGPEFSALPGRSTTRTFALPLQNLLPGTIKLTTAVAARSAGVGSTFTAVVNGVTTPAIQVPAVGTGQYDAFAREVVQTATINSNNTAVSLTIHYTPGSFNSQGWLNWFRVFGRRNLALPVAGFLAFRDWATVGATAVGYQLSAATAATQVWDITDEAAPVKMLSTLSNGTLQFSREARQLREFVAFSGDFLSPQAEGRLTTQNLHGGGPADMLVICHPSLLAQAQRLAAFHTQHDGYKVTVATTVQVFNEFASGSPDPAAIRDYAKMYYDRFGASASPLKYLLLFGKASFDYKDRVAANTNLVPAYESPASLDPLATYTSDDFFGFLDDAEDINSAVRTTTIDVGIGRIPATTAAEAKAFVDKLLDYHSAEAFGPWRNNAAFVADDEDGNLHLQDAEVLTATAAATDPQLSISKIYLDAFQQEGASSGGRYPGANAAINGSIYNGTLIWNYSGHGGSMRLAEETVLDGAIVAGFANRYRLPVFITATCDFAPYDNPAAQSLGENLVLRPATGAIALTTTTRVVFANSNRIINNNYLQTTLQPLPGGGYPTLGDAVRQAKNLTYATSADVVNNRKFALLGDPAMRPAFPKLSVVVTSVNGRPVAMASDTLSSTEFAVVDGEVRNSAGGLQTNFKGTAYLTLFDKPKTITTLANDASSMAVPFQEQSSTLFKGKASVDSGRFSFRFRVPADIAFQYGAGKMSLYANSDTTDGAGFSSNIIIGGASAGLLSDREGPQIKAYLNDNRFASGGITNAAPVLLLKLADSSGISTGSSGIDHDLVATLDGAAANYFVLNNFYQSDVDNYQRGEVRFQLPELSPGAHTLTIKAWDVVNNSSEYTLAFTVATNETLQLAHVLNYPNPFTTRTAFWFEHNYPGVNLYAKVEIFTVSGKLINTLAKTINTPGNRSVEIDWDGTDAWGGKVAAGVYLYRLQVRSANGKTATKWERMALLR